MTKRFIPKHYDASMGWLPGRWVDQWGRKVVAPPDSELSIQHIKMLIGEYEIAIAAQGISPEGYGYYDKNDNYVEVNTDMDEKYKAERRANGYAKRLAQLRAELASREPLPISGAARYSIYIEEEAK